MLCRTGKHDYLDPVSAGRCCSGRWLRVSRLASQTSDLDPLGQTRVSLRNTVWVYGWIAAASGEHGDSEPAGDLK